MNKKGFTLVELLAVIAILAILILIAIPNVMQLYNESKKETFTTELKLIVKAARNQWMNESMFETNEQVYARVQNETCSKSLKLSGREEINYYIKLNKNGSVTKFYATDGTYQYQYNGTGLNIEEIENVSQVSNLSESDILIVSCTGGTGGPKIATFISRQEDGVLTPGDELTIFTEDFYVVSSNSSETVLFTRFELDINNNIQKPFGSTLTFSNIGYWDSCKYGTGQSCPASNSGLISPYNDKGEGYCLSHNGTNCAYVYDSNSNLYSYIEAYANKYSTLTGLNITGRLMTLEEACSISQLGTLGKEILKTHPYKGTDYLVGGYYWLGSANNVEKIWSVDLYGGINPCSISNGFGVRPVLVIPTDAL